MRLSPSGVKPTHHPWAAALGPLRPAILTPQNRKETLQPYDLLRDRCCLPTPASVGVVPLTPALDRASLVARRAITITLRR